MKKKVGGSISWLMSVLLVFIVCFLVSAGSCAFTSEGLSLLSGDYTYPTLEHFTLENETSAIIHFSHKVTFPQLDYYVLNLNEKTENENSVVDSRAQLVGSVHTKIQEKKIENLDKNIFEYSLTFPFETEAHLQYILSGTVKDDIGSTLSFTLSFSGYNSRVPRMIFSEISTEYSKPRTEFVEIYILEDGNLAGVVLHSASDGIDKDYVFPSVEVKKGERVVLHMRTIEEGAVNELGSDITLSNTKLSSPEGRDIYISGTETRLSKNDVLLLRERFNGTLLDAVAYVDGIKEDWPKDAMFEYVIEAIYGGLWEEEALVSFASNIEYITATRTFCRQNVIEIAENFNQGQTLFPYKKEDWIIVATSNLSPGKENSTNAYSK